MKIVSSILEILTSIFLILIGAILVGGGIAEKSILMVVIGLILFAISIIIVFSTRKKLAYSQKFLQNKEKMYRKMKYKFTFVSGLPLMHGVLCKVISTYDKIVIESQGTIFELAKEKITSISIEKNITNHTQAVSSTGGAIAGAMAFGVIGAAIGGRTMSKNVKTKKYYIVITYFDNEENVKYIVFDNSSKAHYLVEDFKTFHRDNLVKKVVEIN